jgi:hypothetical protein
MAASEYLIGYLWFVVAWLLAGYLICALYRTRNNGSGRGLDFTRDDIWFGWLFNFGIDGAHLSYAPEESGHAISLRKHVTDDPEYHVVLELPVCGIAARDIAMLREYCAAHGLPVESAREDGEEVLSVDCVNDGVEAYKLALEIWTKIFHSNTQQSFRREVSGIPVDDPDIGPCTWPFVLVPVGLALTALASIGAPPDWSAPLGRATLSGSTASLALFIAYFLLALLRAVLPARRYLIQSTVLRFLNLGGLLVRFTLPIAVLLVWAGAAG